MVFPKENHTSRALLGHSNCETAPKQRWARWRHKSGDLLWRLPKILTRYDQRRREHRGKPGRRARTIWSRASTWGLLLLLIYFALDGVSPFINEPTAMRAVATSSAGGVLMERLSKLLICAACLIFALQRHRSVCRLSMQMKLVTCFPILALLLFPVSQQPTRTISSATLLLGGVLLLYYIMSRFTLEQVLELFLILGTTTIAASIVFALALPQYGLDQKSGLETAWKGIFSAKNYLGNVALFFLTATVSYRARNSFLRSIRVSQICLCLTAIAFSRAATAYTLTAVYLVYFVFIKTCTAFARGTTLSSACFCLRLLSRSR